MAGGLHRAVGNPWIRRAVSKLDARLLVRGDDFLLIGIGTAVRDVRRAPDCLGMTWLRSEMLQPSTTCTRC